MIEINKDWQLGSDRVQWILRKRVPGAKREQSQWRAVSFVSSTKDILTRCMREKGVPDADARHILDTLPKTFKAWRSGRDSKVRVGEHAI
jgi:hypothetical protein